MLYALIFACHLNLGVVFCDAMGVVYKQYEWISWSFSTISQNLDNFSSFGLRWIISVIIFMTIETVGYYKIFLCCFSKISVVFLQKVDLFTN